VVTPLPEAQKSTTSSDAAPPENGSHPVWKRDDFPVLAAVQAWPQEPDDFPVLAAVQVSAPEQDGSPNELAAARVAIPVAVALVQNEVRALVQVVPRARV
jgi:hypothetical protein